jgi:transposase-like protein
MTPTCPNLACDFRHCKAFVVKDGRFYRQSEARFIQRFRCTKCRRKFSHATGTLEFGQNKRRVNCQLRRLLCANVSMRRCARLLNIHRTTVERKLAYLAKKAGLSQQRFLEQQRGQVAHLQFDDLITSEHTKMKPLTVSLAVDAGRRFILGAQVERIGAFGHLAKLSRAKYGPRPNRHVRALNRLFKQISPTVALGARIESDEHSFYPPVIARWLPGREHQRYPGGRAAIAGQGELKKGGHDPLFSINHSCAMLRACMNRLIRKTWCTTKRPERLQQHLDVFIDYYNQDYLPVK